MLNLQQLDLFADILQILNYVQNVNQTSNDAILSELQKQDEKFLKQILKNQADILERLERLEKNV